MALSSEKTGKTIEEARLAALAELGVPEEDTVTEVIEEPSKGFFGLIGGRLAKVRVTVKEKEAPAPHERPERPEYAPRREDTPEREVSAHRYAPSTPSDEAIEKAIGQAKGFLSQIFDAMHLEVSIHHEPGEDAQFITLSGEDLGILIGKHGQTLDSLQYLVNLAANKGVTESRTRIVLDVEHYRERREETLRRLASRLADRVARTRQKVILEPMNRHERRIIHMALQGNRSVSTYSAGDEPFRKVVIEPYRERRHYRQSSDYRPSGDYRRGADTRRPDDDSEQ